MNFEILAPAGSPESLVAGVRSGADAVYLGGKSFNARRSAGNFDDEELKKAVKYCHQRDVKVYLAANILVSDDEMPDAYNLVKTALEAGIDAFIVQDIGLADMIKKHFPSARLHASTQMSIITPSGVRESQRLGFSRVVLPREMSLGEIEEMKKASSCELEIFVHGALCMSVSGQCYLSSVIGSRSGNRGLCAQPCRLPFTAGGKKSYALSLKDMSLIGDLDMLDGIKSLKIEGRMKRPEYVSAAVTAIRKARIGDYSGEDIKLLESVFSRSGFTDGYLFSRLGSDMFGIRRKEDVTAAEKVLKKISLAYRNETPLVPIDMEFVCKKGKNAVLTARALGRKAVAEGAKPEKAVGKPMTAESVKARLSKLGGTQFYAGDIKISLDDDMMLSAAKINAMRREVVKKINDLPQPQVKALPLSIIPAASKNGEPYATAVFTNAAQIPPNHPFERIFIPLDSKIDDFVDNRAGAVLPRGLFGIENEICARLKKLKKAGVKKVLCGNIGSYALARDMGFDVYGDFGLNIYNTQSANMIKSPVLSFELRLDKINKINAHDTGIIAYGRLLLMLMRNCPVKNDIGCAECGKNGFLTDRKNIRFPVLCSKYPCTELLNSVPLYMLDRTDEIKTDFIQFNFTTETAKQASDIIALYKNRQKPDFDFTRGLYYRGVI